jgi:hypothetical protein
MFWNFVGGLEIQKAFQYALIRYIWTYLVGIIVIRGILFILGQGKQHQKRLKKLFKKIKENCYVLERSICTREALVHSIPISEVKDMKSYVL